MADAAYSASIELLSPVPASIAAGSELALTFKVRNTSGHEWRQPQVGPLALGNHWLDAGGELMVAQDDGRAPLLQIVPPGLEWPVLMTMKAPAAPGRYISSRSTWCTKASRGSATKGSPTLRFAIDVMPASGTVRGAFVSVHAGNIRFRSIPKR